MILIYHRALRINTLLFLLLISIVFLSTCKTRQKIHTLSPKEILSDSVLIKQKTHEFNFSKLSAKIDVLIDIDGKTQSFAANIRLKKDSILWVSVTPFLGIEMMRLVITQDSVKILNRIDNTYFLADNNYLKTLLKADIDFNMLQSILIGNDFPHFASDGFEITRQDSTYCLTAQKRTKLKNVYNNSNLTISEVICLNDRSFKIIKNDFTNLEEKYKFETSYSNFKTIDNQSFPNKIDCKITTGDHLMNVSLEYSKLNLNADFSYPFVIPDKYTKMP